MTALRSRVFVSYRRARSAEVALLVQALRDVGLLPWQDVSDLRHEPTEAAIRACIRDPSTAGAILFLTPEVRDSEFIRRVEVPEILRRHQAGDGFWLVPVVAGGLGYADAPAVLADAVGAEELAAWNLHVADEPFSPAAAARVAAAALRERILELDAALPADMPLRVRLTVRPAHHQPADALVLDWRTRFTQDASADATVWDSTLLPALRTLSDTLGQYAGHRPLLFTGTPPLPAAFALGHAFSALDPRPVAWLQHDPAAPGQPWSLADARDETYARERGWTVRFSNGAVEGRHLAVLVNVTHDTAVGYAGSRAALPPMRARIVVDHRDALAAPPEQRPGIQIADGAEAASLARLVRQAIRNALSQYGHPDAVHLFFAGPAGLAMLIGQLTNTLPPIVTYDFLRYGGRYTPAATLRPPTAW